MIKNLRKIENIEKQLIRKSKQDYRLNFKIVDAMYRETRLLNRIPSDYVFEELEIDIKYVRLVNSVR